MKKFGILLFTILFISSSTLIIKPSVTFACSCVNEQTVQQEFSQSKAVFSGKVIDIKTTKFSNPNYKKVLFEVSKTWKGISKSQVIIKTGQGDGDCGFKFTKGQNYLVYARSSKMYGENERTLTTTICDATKEFSVAQKDLTILGEGKKPSKNVNYEENFQGNIFEDLFKFILIGSICTIIIVIIFKLYRKKRI
ncbi:hypothetical protein [Bacillus sp. AFS041924]|uniref:hypothetical protein n=1 Tax=Bacillus sp. AFS041924 TaxID=2033503 RepID=UPI000BFDD623|nr:hypothetical protein [Bacillus sp. AFS041924]PGS55798.1 hypothetical protein COC46_02225 [Bacillus sp. AFS041924]